MKEQHNFVHKETDAAKKAVQEQEKKAKKKKKKVKKTEYPENEEDRTKTKMAEAEGTLNLQDNTVKVDRKAAASIRTIVTITLWILILCSIICLLFGFILYDNCTVPSHRWIPKSTEFCSDAKRSWARRQLSPTFHENLRKVFVSMLGVLVGNLANMLYEVSELGIWNSIVEFTNTVHTKAVGLFLLAYRLLIELKDATVSLINQHTANLIVEYLNYFGECVVISLKIALAIGHDLIMITGDYVVDAFIWYKNFVSLAVENPAQAWLRFKALIHLV